MITNLVEDIKDKRIIYIGEFHDSYSHHGFQLEIIKKLYEENEKTAVGMEMFQSKFQHVIDKYFEGKISKSEFLDETEYQRRWGFDFSLYEPVIEFIRQNKIKLIALNMDTEIIKKVSGESTASLTVYEKKKIPERIDFGNEEYRRMLFGIYSENPKLFQKDFSRFHRAQVVRDEAMAENIDGFLKQHPDYRIVILAGNGHIMYSHGIPSRTYYRNNIDYVTIVSDLGYTPSIADYIINTDPNTNDSKRKIPEPSEE